MKFLVTAVIAALLAQAACRNTGSSVYAPPVISDGQHTVGWSTPAAPRFAAGRGPAGANGLTATSPSITTSTFWVYTNREVNQRVSVLGPNGWQEYVAFMVPWGSLLRRPDGTSFTSVDSIAMTITLDLQSLQVEMEPRGLAFNPQVPARLSISYADATLDLDRNGSVNWIDEYISQVLLGVRERQHPGDPWLVVPSLNDIISQSLSVDIRRLNGHAVSW